MDLQSTQIKQIVDRGGLLYLFSEGGVDIYRQDTWQRQAWASLPGVRCGAVNDLGVWLGTAFGVWHLPHGVSGGASSRLTLTYTDLTATALASADVKGLAGLGSALAIVTAAGVDFIPAPGAAYRYAGLLLPGAVALSSTALAYAVQSGLHLVDIPTADWDATAATVLSTTSTPALLSDTVQALAWGTDLFIGTAGGLNVFDPVAVTLVPITSELGTVTDVKALSPTPTATGSTGFCAVGTANGVNGGQFTILKMG